MPNGRIYPLYIFEVLRVLGYKCRITIANRNILVVY